MPNDAEIVALPEWRYDNLYSDGLSVDRLFGRAVYGEGGEEIGDVEDFIIGPNGEVLSVIAEVGGFWDIGDTHVSVPLDRVDMTAGDRIVVPVTEETVDDYDFWDDENLTAEQAETEVVENVDGAELPRAWRASELIGDRARLRQDVGFDNYGYVNDIILRDGAVAAVIVQPRATYGRGYRAYPYFGYGSGWYAGQPYYDLPYSRDEIGDTEEFDYDLIDN